VSALVKVTYQSTDFPCTVSSQSHSQIVCVTTAGRGQSLVATIDVGGRTVTSSSPNLFSYSPPTLTTVSPLSGPTAGGTELTLVGSSFDTSGSVTVGGANCPIVSYTSTQIRCTSPAGQGLSQAVAVVSGLGLASTNQLSFSYNAPIVSSINPTTASTGPGVRLLTILGSNFGLTGRTVTVGGIACPLDTASSNTHVQLVCQLPFGSGVSKAVSVTVASQASSGSATFSYSPPALSSLSASSTATVGGGTLTIVGTSLSNDNSKVSVTVGAAACTSPQATHTQVLCTLPAGTGAGLNVRITVDSQASNQLQFSYAAPTLSSLNPVNGAVVGGYPLTLAGTNFGASGSSVTLGGSDCPVTSQTQSEVVCTVPAGEGINKGVSILTNGQFSNSLTFSYQAPVISTVTPANAGTAGGIPLVIGGSNFGPSSSVTVGPSACPITSLTATQITCTLPTGIGLNVPVIVSVITLTSNTFAYNYGSPSLSGISPTSGDTAGGYVLTLSGSNFGAAVGSVSVAGAPCAPQSGQWGHTQIICVMPAGQGVNQGVTVTAGGQTTTAVNFNYNAPTLTSLSPLSGPTGGGIPLTLSGTNFGISGNFTLGSRLCLYSGSSGSYSAVKIVCQLPVGSGTNLAATLTVAGQTATASFGFSYSAPQLISISPSSGSTAGGQLITLTGTSFDTSGTVTIGGTVCTSPTWGHSQVVCALPAGQGLNRVVSLTTVSGVTSTNTLTFSYAAPVLSSISPSSAVSAGNIPITLSGANFGQSASVTIGGAACTVTSQTSSQFVCTLPAGSGINQAVILTVASQTSNTVLFSYSAPALTSISPATFVTSGNVPITLTGTSFGSASANGMVSFGQVTCPVVTWGHSQIICTLPPGQGTNLAFMVTVSQQSSNTLLFSYAAPTLTLITPTLGLTGPAGATALITIVGTSFGLGSPTASLSGVNCPVTSANHTVIFCQSPVGNGKDLQLSVTVAAQVSTNQLLFSYRAPTLTSLNPPTAPTAGGSLLTITGTSLGVSSIIITVGGQPCPVNTATTHTQVVCVLPAGQGTTLPVVLSTAAQVGNTLTFSYSPPAVSTVTPVNGPTSGGTVITLTGSSFGISGSVLIGGVSCVLIPGTYSHAGTQCSVPVGSGVNLPITVTVASQATTATAAFSYNPPTIASISPLTGITAGGYALTIQGASFTTTGTVTVGGKVCVPTGAGYGQNRIECLVPPGRGIGVTITVNATGRMVSVSTFNYLTPAITSVTPASVPAIGGTAVTLAGVNFGQVVDSALVVTVNGASVTVVSVGDTSLVFNSPAALGINLQSLPISVSVAQQLTPASGVGSAVLSYDAPVVTSLSSSTAGCVASGNALSKCPFDTGAVITITGANFGDSSVPVTVTVGVYTCGSVTKSSTNPYTTVVCTVPVGTGTNLLVAVTVAGRTGSAALFSYSTPLIYAQSLSASSGSGSLSGAVTLTAPVPANVQVTIQGESFGDVSATTVTFGPAATPFVGLFSCVVTSVTIATPNVLICTLPTAVGSALVFRVSVTKSGIGTLISPLSTDTLTYPVPSLVGGTLDSLTASYVGKTVVQGTYSNGEPLQFDALNVGSDGSLVTVTYGPSSDPTIFTCAWFFFFFFFFFSLFGNFRIRITRDVGVGLSSQNESRDV
jgi:hypothetical protein